MIRMMTYNIKNGGQDSFEYGRLALATRVIVAESPDVLVMQELMYAGLEGNRALHQIENDTGMRSFLGKATTGQHVAVLVRKGARITRSEVDSVHFHHATVEIGVVTTHGPMTVIGTHLCPHGGTNRLGESQRLASSASADRMVLLMGDLNSLDPWQNHEERVASLPAHYRSRHLTPGADTRWTHVPWPPSPTRGSSICFGRPARGPGTTPRRPSTAARSSPV